MNAHVHPSMAAALRQFAAKPTADELSADHDDNVGEKARALVSVRRAEQIGRVTNVLLARLEDYPTFVGFVARMVASGVKDPLIESVMFELACAEVES
jgi:hypothetical protein